MRRVYSSQDLIMAGHVRSLLAQQGIDCHLRNENLAGAIGEIPPIECWPEVWIADDDEYPRAKAIIDDALSEEAVNSPPWRCRCGEELEGQFSHCWNCGAGRDDV